MFLLWCGMMCCDIAWCIVMHDVMSCHVMSSFRILCLRLGSLSMKCLCVCKYAYPIFAC